MDLLFNALLGFTFLFLIAILFINPQSRKGRVDLKAEYIISVSWQDHLRDDLDLWVRDPAGAVVSYLRKEAGWLHLDRDDRGEVNDTIEIAGRPVVYPVNQEVVTIRGIIPGEYTVNVYYYEAAGGQPLTALVKVEKVNPTLKTVFVRELTLENQDQEATALRFELSAAGELVALNQLPAILTPYALDPDTNPDVPNPTVSGSPGPAQ